MRFHPYTFKEVEMLQEITDAVHDNAIPEATLAEVTGALIVAIKGLDNIRAEIEELRRILTRRP